MQHFREDKVFSTAVSMPQAARGCMQLCSLEALQHKAPKWGFGQEMTFSVIFAISEHARLSFPRKGIGSIHCHATVSGTHDRNGQVFVSRRSFLAFVHNLPTHIFYPNLPAFSIPFTKKPPLGFRFFQAVQILSKTKKRDWRRKISSCNSPFL